jgi:hypothetical protein
LTRGVPGRPISFQASLCSGMDARPAFIQGALLFVTEIYCNYRDSPYKHERGRENDGRPSSKQASPRLKACTTVAAARRARAARSAAHRTRAAQPRWVAWIRTAARRGAVCTRAALPRSAFWDRGTQGVSHLQEERLANG